ncbi:hypothetical protein BKA67DRAFT_217038 [Truncatella angustata]|uniref:Uncharacterized protein n=1 Tax=Truncatella angustata TaxID=152316 RepID=A0A9P8UUP0_9PEZI|nr:uncharacterized protein BKA67DRAFT_217038 [Truncatella angustata]KAH6658553.1 hypothetical protein BKA67DRAFT_217038 [Truncatella angustata]
MAAAFAFLQRNLPRTNTYPTWIAAADSKIKEVKKALDDNQEDIKDTATKLAYHADDGAITNNALDIRSMKTTLDDLQKDRERLSHDVKSRFDELSSVIDAQPTFLRDSLQRLKASKVAELLHHFLEVFHTLDLVRDLSDTHKQGLFHVEVELLKGERDKLKLQIDNGLRQASQDVMSREIHDELLSRCSTHESHVESLKQQMRDDESARDKREQTAQAATRKLRGQLALYKEKADKFERDLNQQRQDFDGALDTKERMIDDLSHTLEAMGKSDKDNEELHEQTVRELVEQQTSLTRKLQRRDRSIRSLKETASRLGQNCEADLAALRSDYDALKEQASAAESDIMARDAELERFHRDAEEFDKQREESEKAQYEASRMLAEATARERDWLSEIEQLNIQLQHERRKAIDATAAKNEAVAEFNNLHTTHQELKNSSAVIKVSLTILERRHGELASERDAANQARICGELDLVRAAGERDISRAQRDRLQTQIGSVRNELSEVEGARDALASANKALQVDINAFEEERASLLRENVKSRRECRSISDTSSELVLNTLMLRSRCNLLGRHILAVRKQLAAERAAASTLRDVSARRFGIITDVELERDEKIACLRGMTTDRDTWQRRCHDHLTQLIYHEGEHLDLSDENEKLLQAVAGLGEAYEHLDQSTTALQQANAHRISALQMGVDQLTMDQQTQCNQRNADQASIASLEDRIRGGIDTARTTVEELKKQMHAQIATSQAAMEGLKQRLWEQMNADKAALEELEKRLHDQTATSQAAMEDLKKRSQEQMTTDQAAIGALEKRLQGLDKQMQGQKLAEQATIDGLHQKMQDQELVNIATAQRLEQKCRESRTSLDVAKAAMARYLSVTSDPPQVCEDHISSRFLESITASPLIQSSRDVPQVWVVAVPWLAPAETRRCATSSQPGALNLLTQLYHRVAAGHLEVSTFHILELAMAECNKVAQSISAGALCLILQTARTRFPTETGHLPHELFLIGLLHLGHLVQKNWARSFPEVEKYQEFLRHRSPWHHIGSPTVADDLTSLQKLVRDNGLMDEKALLGLLRVSDDVVAIDLARRTIRLVSRRRCEFWDGTGRIVGPEGHENILIPITSGKDLLWWIKNGRLVA